MAAVSGASDWSPSLIAPLFRMLSSPRVISCVTVWLQNAATAIETLILWLFKWPAWACPRPWPTAAFSSLLSTLMIFGLVAAVVIEVYIVLRPSWLSVHQRLIFFLLNHCRRYQLLKHTDNSYHDTFENPTPWVITCDGNYAKNIKAPVCIGQARRKKNTCWADMAKLLSFRN